MPKKVIVVIGGGISGKAAVETLLELPEKTRIILIEKEEKYIPGIEVIKASEAVEVIPEDKLVRIKSKYGHSTLKYDRLIVASGSRPYIPRHLRRMGVIPAKRFLPDLPSNLKEVALYGLGSYGLSILSKIESQKVTVVEPGSEILGGVMDPTFALRVREYISKVGKIKFILKEKIARVYGYERISGFETESGFKPADLIIVDLGIIPNSELLLNKATIGSHRGIVTNNMQETSLENVYACGSCSELLDASLNSHRLIPLPEVSYTSGVIAGYNAMGVKLMSMGYVKSISKTLFGLEILSVGATETDAKRYGIPYYTLEDSFKNILMKAMFEKETGRLLGVQALGPGTKSLSDMIKFSITRRMSHKELLSFQINVENPAAQLFLSILKKAIK